MFRGATIKPIKLTAKSLICSNPVDLIPCTVNKHECHVGWHVAGSRTIAYITDTSNNQLISCRQVLISKTLLQTNG